MVRAGLRHPAEVPENPLDSHSVAAKTARNRERQGRTPLRKQASLFSAILAIVAAMSLSPLMPPAAHAVQQVNGAPAAKAHPKRLRQVQTMQQSAGYVPPGCNKWPYVNMAPPCQSTWPAGDPNYHGSRPGPGP
jgi:hypothetical protein